MVLDIIEQGNISRFILYIKKKVFLIDTFVLSHNLFNHFFADFR